MAEPSPDEAQIQSLVQQGRSGLADGDVGSARAAHGTLLAQAPGHRDTLLLGALLAAVDDDFERSRVALESALERYPGDLSVLVSAASLLLEVHMDPAAALPLLEEALSWLESAEPGDAEALDALELDVRLRLSEAWGQLGVFERAREAAKAAWEMSGDPRTRFALARAHYALGDVEEAQEDLEALEDELGEEAEFAHLAGRVALARGDEAAAERAFRRAAAQDPEGYPLPPRLSPARFEAKVRAALRELPEPLSGYVADMPLELHALPDLLKLKAASPPLPPSAPLLLVGERSPEAPFELLPERLVLFQRNVEVLAASEADIYDVLLSALAQAFTLFFKPYGAEEDEQGLLDEELPYKPEGEA